MSSLVSYGVGSSDESDASDGEESSVPAPAVRFQPQNTRIEPAGQVKTSLFATLPKPKSTSDDGVQKKTSLFSTLPPPKKSAAPSSEKEPKPAVVSSSSSLSSSSSSLLGGTTNNGSSKGFLNLPQPKKKQPVKINLPALPDPDSDEDEPAEKKPKSMKGAGLFSLLPKPKTASRKEANRVLIPYTLTKKPTAAPPLPQKSPASSRAHATRSEPKDHSRANPLVTAYSDDEEEEKGVEGKESSTKGKVNFFSMEEYEKEKEEQHRVSISPPGMDRNPTESSQGSGMQGGQGTQSDNSLIGRTSTGTDFSEELTPPAVPAAQDQPLVFNPSRVQGPGYPTGQGFQYGPSNPGYPQSAHGSDFSRNSDPSGEYSAQDQVGATSYQGSSSTEYYGAAGSGGEDVWQSGEPSLQSFQPQQSFMQDEGFARMVGKKNRGREEIQIIDINADDQIGPTSGLQQMVKSMTEEKEYRGKLKKEQMPTSQQKRKHQITYLARQAKERELELKNQWADNRMTRKQTQAKYGF